MNTSSASKTVSFRLSQDEDEALSARAERLRVSRHDLARHYTLEALGQNEERTALREAITVLHSEIEALRKDITLSVEALLSSAGRISEEKARKWAEENLA